MRKRYYDDAKENAAFERCVDAVTKSELADMMNSFVSDDDDKWLMFNAKFSSADEVYESIYKQAKICVCISDRVKIVLSD